jgi:protein-S-isoprenylcysteine O-methyltransferase Ste14
VAETLPPSAALPRLPLLPPLLALIGVAVMVGLALLAPGVRLIDPPLTHWGWLPIVLGAAFALSARRRFRRADTTIKPYQASSALVSHGVYGFSRNPMYTSLTAGLGGVFILLGSLTPGIVIPVFMWLIRTRVIAVEEAMLEETFGDEFRDYKARVRRWL